MPLTVNTGAFIFRIGFWGHSTISTIRNQNSIGNYLGPYVVHLSLSLCVSSWLESRRLSGPWAQSPLVGYHGELKVNLFHNTRII